MRGERPVRLRDFIRDRDGWLYAVSAYDNRERVGCVLRYVPDPAGERADPAGTRYRKMDFEDAYRLVEREKPAYAGRIHRVPHADVERVFKPEVEFPAVAARDPRVGRVARLFDLPAGTFGCTGSRLCGIEGSGSDIDFVVYGKHWFAAQARLARAIRDGEVADLSEEMWRTVYRKREPEISFDEFVLHEKRKWNRGEMEGTYFDLLYTRDYADLHHLPVGHGEVLGRRRIRARVTDASYAFDSPAMYRVDHEEIRRVLSFTHTYSGQAQAGEEIEACGVCERHGHELWLVIGTTRVAKGEYIRSLTLLGEAGSRQVPG